MWIVQAPAALAARAMLPAPAPLTASAPAAASSAPSTSVHAAQLTTTSGRARFTARRGVGDVERGARERDRLDAGGRGGVDQILAEHPGGPGDQQSHRRQE